MKELVSIVVLLTVVLIAAKTDWIEQAVNSFGNHAAHHLVPILIPSPSPSPSIHHGHHHHH